MTRFFIFFAAVLLLVPGFAPAASAGSSSHTASPVREATPTDAQIDATLRMKLAKSKIGKDGFRFHVQRGVVTWEGNTNVVQHKGSATRMAKAAGAVQVINNIHVSAAAKEKASANLKRASVQP